MAPTIFQKNNSELCVKSQSGQQNYFWIKCFYIKCDFTNQDIKAGWYEYKMNNEKPELIGQYISSLNKYYPVWKRKTLIDNQIRLCTIGLTHIA